MVKSGQIWACVLETRNLFVIDRFCDRRTFKWTGQCSLSQESGHDQLVEVDFQRFVAENPLEAT